MKTITLTLVLLAATQNDPGAIAELRAIGQPAVDALLQWRASQKLDDAGEQRFESAIDSVCKQRDCAWSGLYWYTDFDAAKAAAQSQHKPILTLRLLGNLDEELSCANSRFFRTLLYSNTEISAYLRANFILHWKSVRPVPVMKIDFGDGRVMTRTLTGNSIHYVVSPDGTVLDGLPGLYAPKAFLAQLQEMRRLADGYASWRDKRGSLAAYHSARLTSARRIAGDGKTGARASEVRVSQPSSAWDAAPIAVSKSGTEIPMLDRAWFGKRQRPLSNLEVTWKTMVADDDFAALDEHSLALFRAKRTDARNDTFKAMLKSLKKSLTADTLHNEYDLHTRIHEWLRSDAADLESLNRGVYEELFLTPDSDRWLGLYPRDAYLAIDGDGITTSSAAPADTSARRLSGVPAQSARSHR